ncbi:hypothetical protein [Caballeronia sp. LZ043]|uniref:hypothetical protein n=1 Tax=Caballeronia sp. LZ043 TaxID=3038569 RepID=UPI00285CA563|nr:hypothetical protein [Caballeronia sp. LZ043]MDR5825705.1 hypothetical protein [Caballeronia sp. LZ043]
MASDARLTPAGVIGDAISEGSRLTAFAWHHMGRQAEARRLLAGVLEAFDAQCRQSRLSDNHVNGREGTRSLMASVLWFQGCAERALEEAYRARRDAEASGHTLTIGYVLVFAFIPLSFYAGDLDAAEEALDILQDCVAKNGLALFDAMARGLHGALLIERNERQGLTILSDALAQLEREHLGMRQTLFAGLYAHGLSRFGRHAEAQAVIDDALARAKQHDELWNLPELLRIAGEIRAASGSGDAEGLFKQALEVARQQGALFFELRAAKSLARYKHAQGESGHARALLSEVCERFPPGCAIVDVREARALLDSWRAAE